MAIGGDLPGNNIDDSKLPANYWIDYVRVYAPDWGWKSTDDFYKL